MFKNKFKFQIRTEIIDGIREAHEVIITQYTPNGKVELSKFVIQVIDVPEVIKMLEGFKL